MSGGAHSLTLLALSATLALGACGTEVKRGGAIPVDTAAIVPVRGTTIAGGYGANTAGSDTALIDAGGIPPLSTLPAPPSTIPAPDSASGEVIFHGRGRCFTCHGQRGQGTPRLGPVLADSVWLAGNGSLQAIGIIITRGVAVPRAAAVAMPAYSGMLTPEEIELTAAYVYTLSHPGSTVPGSPAADSVPAPQRPDST